MRIPILGPLIRKLTGGRDPGPRQKLTGSGRPLDEAGTPDPDAPAPLDDTGLPTIELPSGVWDYAVFPAGGGRAALQLRDPADRRNRMVAWIDGDGRELDPAAIREHALHPYRRCWVGQGGITWCVEVEPDGPAKAFIDRGTSDTEATHGMVWTRPDEPAADAGAPEARASAEETEAAGERPDGDAAAAPPSSGGLPWHGLGTATHAALNEWFESELRSRPMGRPGT